MTDEADLRAYVAALEAYTPGPGSKRMRGLSLYYQWTGCPAMAALAHEIREQRSLSKIVEYA
jgi:hypothetical protein